MGRHMTPGTVVLVDDPQRCAAALVTSLEYADRTVAIAEVDLDLPGLDEVVRPGRRGPTIDEAFRVAAARRMPWVALRRDLADPPTLLAAMLEATARHASKDIPGFGGLLIEVAPPVIRRILAVVDLRDDHPSGLMTLVAVGAAMATEADLDVLVLGAPGQSLATPSRADDILRISRDRDLYDVAQQRAAASGRRATWITVDDVDDRVAVVLDQIAGGAYDLVIEDLGAISLGGRVGRGRRIDRALGPDGPGAIARAVLDHSDVAVAVVLDGIRIGVVPPAVVKGGAGVLIAVGMVAAAAPTASASSSDRAQVHTTVSQAVDAYERALDEAGSLASPAEVEAATAAAQASAAASRAAVDEATGGSASQADAPETGAPDGGGAAEDMGEADVADAGPGTAGGAESSSAAAGIGTVGSPADLHPEEVVPQEAPAVDPDTIEVADDVDSKDVAKATKAAEESKAELADSRAEFESTQQEAIAASEAVQSAAAETQDAAAELHAAQQAYEAVYEQTEARIADDTGLSGALGGSSAQAEVDAAVQAQADALKALEAARLDAEQALIDYQQVAMQANVAQADLERAAAGVTEADAAHQEARATARATESAYEKALADARVSPVPGYEVTTQHGQSGAMWSSGTHTGVDYAAPTGTEVVAAASGTVVEVSSGGSYGNRIVVQHDDGIQTSYSHLSSTDVAVGQEVTAGQHIGAVGSTGNSSGPHLHFEVTQGGDGWSSGHFLDPTDWLAGTAG